MRFDRELYYVGNKNENKDSKSGRVGKRLREIREARGLAQNAFEGIGLSSERIQQYERGYRTVGPRYCKRIAEILNVDELALMDPTPCDSIGAMRCLFEMEKRFDIMDLSVEVLEDRAEIKMNIPKGQLAQYIDAWAEKKRQSMYEYKEVYDIEKRKRIKEDYIDWKANFPKSADLDLLSKKWEERKNLALKMVDMINRKKKEQGQKWTYEEGYHQKLSNDRTE